MPTMITIIAVKCLLPARFYALFFEYIVSFTSHDILTQFHSSTHFADEKTEDSIC